MGPEIVRILLLAEVKPRAVGVIRQDANASVLGIDHKKIDKVQFCVKNQ